MEVDHRFLTLVCYVIWSCSTVAYPCKGPGWTMWHTLCLWSF